jgi:hypothetical protein
MTYRHDDGKKSHLVGAAVNSAVFTENYFHNVPAHFRIHKDTGFNGMQDELPACRLSFN